MCVMPDIDWSSPKRSWVDPREVVVWWCGTEVSMGKACVRGVVDVWFRAITVDAGSRSTPSRPGMGKSESTDEELHGGM